MFDQPINLNNLPGKGSIYKRQFENGSTILAYPNLISPAVYFRGYLPVGSLSDPAGKTGLANFTTAMLSTGTIQNDFRSLHLKIESCGASISISAGTLSTVFGGQCLKEDLPLILNLLLEMLSEPAFPQDHFERVKNQLLTMIKILSQNTEEMANQAFDRLYYRDHPYSLPNIGYANTVSLITPEDLQTFHQSYFGPDGMVFAISGGIEPERAVNLVDQVFSRWQPKKQLPQINLPDFKPPAEAMREHISINGKSETDLIIGTSAPKTMSQDYQVSSIGNSILGQFGMMGRIGEVLREQSGLAYYAGSSLEAGLGPTCWKVSAGVNPSNLEKAIEKIYAELNRFLEVPVTQSELDDVKSQALGQLPLSLETNAGIVRLLLSLERYKLSLDYLRELPQILAVITAEDVLENARHYWNLDRLVVASAGRAI